MSKPIPESRRRALQTKDEVMAALGGIRPVSALTGADWKNVETWNRAKTFPSRYYLVMTHALRRKRLSAPPELWGMVTPAERRETLTGLVAARRQQAAS